jgi:hypothetical protein
MIGGGKKQNITPARHVALIFRTWMLIGNAATALPVPDVKYTIALHAARKWK